jgi:hypothetical protein
VFVFGAASNTAIGYKQDHYMASMAQFAGAAVAVLALVMLAFAMPKRPTAERAGAAPSAWLVGAVTLLFGSAALFVPKEWGWVAVAELLGLDVVMLLAVLAWSRRGGWGLNHQLALGAGAALAYGWHAFLQHPAVGGAGMSVRVGNAMFLAGAIGLVWFGVRRCSAENAAHL